MPIQPNQLSVREILEIIFENWFLFVVCVLLGALAGGVVWHKSEKWYQSQAHIYVSTKSTEEPLLANLGVTTDVNLRFNSVRYEMLANENLIQIVEGIHEKAAREGVALPTFPKNVTEAAEQIKSGSSLRTGIRAGQIFVVAERRDPREAQFLVDYLSEYLKDELSSRRKTELGETLTVLERLLAQYEARLRDAEEVLREFDEIHGLQLSTAPEGTPAAVAEAFDSDDVARLSARAKGPSHLVGEYLRLAAHQSEVAIELQTKRAQLAEINAQIAETPEYVVSVSTSERSQASRSLENRIADEGMRLALLRRDKSEKHPDVVEQMETIARLEHELAGRRDPIVTEEERHINPVVGDLRLRRSELQADVAALEAENDELSFRATTLRDSIREIPNKELEKSRLRRELGIWQNMYHNIRLRLENARLTDSLEDKVNMPNFLYIDRATLEEDYVRPKTGFILLISIFLGALAGVGLSFLRELTDTSFRNIDDASRFLDLPVLGVIPQVTEKDRRRYGRRRKPKTA